MFRKKLTSIITSAVVCLGMTCGVIAVSAEEADEKLYTFDELSAMSDEDFLKLDGAQKLYDRIKYGDVEYYFYDLDGYGNEIEVFGGISGWLFGNVKGREEYTANITEAKIENLLGDHINYTMEGPTDLTKDGLWCTNLSIHCNDLRIDRNENHDLEISDSNISDMAKFWYCVNQVIELGYIEINSSLDSAPSNEKVMTGDVNLDMKIDLTDVDYMEKGLSGELKLTESQMEIADVNGDGTFDELDVEKLKADIAAPATVPVSEDNHVLKTLAGDADGDGEFKINDLVSVKNWIVGKGEIENWKNSDMNDDGIIDVFDFCLMKRELLKMYPNDDTILSVNLTKYMSGNPVTGAEADEEFVLGQTEFALNLFKNTVSDEKNTLVSPYSVMQALAMTANGADNDTKAEMEKVLGGMPIEKLNEYLYTQRIGQPNDEKCKLSTANSIWYRNDPRLTVLPEFLQRNADYYGASAYSSPFDNTTVNDINNWVSQKTDNMIPDLLNYIPEDARMFLINAVAFDAKWENQYLEYHVHDESHFKAFDGSSQEVRMMSSVEHQYLEDENATGFYKYYEGGRYAFAALLPNEGMTVSEYINTLTPESLYNTLSNSQEKEVHAVLPKFGYDYDVLLNNTLSDMGMSDAFNIQKADFTKMIKSEENIYIDSVFHKTHIDVTEEGTRAAAVTAVMVCGAAAPGDEIKYVTLNRPFVYCIVDTQTSLPVFIGAVNSVEG